MKLKDLTLKQIGILCANQNCCFKNNIACPLWSKTYDRCHLDHSFAPYSISQELLDIEIDDSLLEESKHD